MVKKFLLSLIACCLATTATAFVPTKQATRFISSTITSLHAEEEKKNKVLDFMLNPYESKIPKEMEAEIYRAEGNTPAAQARTQRVLGYSALCLVLVGCAFFNAFLTELRHSDIMEGSNALSLAELGFGWVQANFLFRFVFLNKIGGGGALIAGAMSGLLAEAEVCHKVVRRLLLSMDGWLCSHVLVLQLDSRRKNAERIWEELERRRNANESTKKKKKRVEERRKKKKSGKQAKRLGALSEVVLEEKPEMQPPQPQEIKSEKVEEKQEDGLVGTLKGWYEKADSMAASQALLLNKKLEEEGLVDKITDETGLKVIGKEAAAKLQTKGEDGAELEQEKSKK